METASTTPPVLLRHTIHWEEGGAHEEVDMRNQEVRWSKLALEGIKGTQVLTLQKSEMDNTRGGGGGREGVVGRGGGRGGRGRGGGRGGRGRGRNLSLLMSE